MGVKRVSGMCDLFTIYGNNEMWLLLWNGWNNIEALQMKRWDRKGRGIIIQSMKWSHQTKLMRCKYYPKNGHIEKIDISSIISLYFNLKKNTLVCIYYPKEYLSSQQILAMALWVSCFITCIVGMQSQTKNKNQAVNQNCTIITSLWVVKN